MRMVAEYGALTKSNVARLKDMNQLKEAVMEKNSRGCADHQRARRKIDVVGFHVHINIHHLQYFVEAHRR